MRERSQVPGDWEDPCAPENGAPAQPFCGRFIRALSLVLVAAMAHTWIERAPRSEHQASMRPAADRPAQNPAGGQDRPVGPAASLGRVTVETRLVPVPVGTAGASTARAAAARPKTDAVEPPARPAAHAVRAAAEAPGPITVADRGRRDTGPAEPEGSATNGDGNAMAEGDVSLRFPPIAAAPRPPAVETRLAAAPAASTRASARSRVIKAAPIVEPDQKVLVNRVLEQYIAAYERLDAGAAKVVYPAVNETALRRAFNQLEAQQLTFESCGITIKGSGANARCQGQAAYRPRVGPRSLHRASREWTFDLAKADDGWHIVKATVR